MALKHVYVQSNPNTAPPIKRHLHFAPMKVHGQKLTIIAVFQSITTHCSEQTVVPYQRLTVFILSAFTCHLGEFCLFSSLLL